MANDITLREVRDSLVRNNQAVVEEQFETKVVLNSLLKRFEEMIKLTKGNALDEAERRREEKNEERGPERPESGPPPMSSIDFSFADRLIAGATLGVAGLFAYIDTATHDFVEKVREDFVDFVNGIQKIQYTLNHFLFKPIGSILNSFSKAVMDTPLAKGTKAFFGAFVRVFGFIGGVLNKGVILATGGLSALLPNMQFLTNIGKIFSKLFLPLTVFITAWDTVKGAIAGYEEGGIIGGIQGAVDGFFNSLIGAPVELLKMATAWVLDRMGFENAAATLNSINFRDIFSAQIDEIFDSIKAIGGYITDIFKGEFSMEKAKALLGELFNISPVGMIGGLIDKLIPDMFSQIETIFGNIVDSIAVNSEIMLRKIINVIQNLPDRLLQFLSENVRIQMPRIAIPLPFTDKELVITEGTEIGVPGRDEAAERIAQRNAQLESDVEALRATMEMRRTPNVDARLLELGRTNLSAATAANNNVVVDNSTVAPTTTSVTNRMDSPVPAAADERMTL